MIEIDINQKRLKFLLKFNLVDYICGRNQFL